MMPKNWKKWLYPYGFLLLLIPMLALVVRANIDLTIGRYALFGDEIITLDEVKEILHPQNFRHWIWAIGNGDEFKYGRILFYLNAAVCWLPEKLGGEQAQIITTRFFQAFIWLSAIWILSIGFVKNKILQTLLFFFILFQPFTIYYSTMPKPEPEQLLFLGLYLYLSFKKQDLMGWQLFFLGLAWGSKISLMPVVVFLWLVITLQKGFTIKRTGRMIAYTVFGLFVAVPSFIKVLWFDFQPIKRYQEQVSEVIEVIGEVRENDIFTWVNYLFYRFTHINAYAIAIWVVFALVLLIAHTNKKSVKDYLFSWPLILLGIAAAWALPIMLIMNRLWGFYLQIPIIIAFVAFFLLLEEQWPAIQKHLSNRIFRLSIGLSCSFVAVFTGYHLVRQSYFQAQKLFYRSKEYSYQIPRYRIINGFLNHLHSQTGKQLKVSMEGVLFWPKNSPIAYIEPWYYPFYHWDKNFDVLILQTKGLYKPIDPRTIIPQGGMNWFVTRLWAKSAAEFALHANMAGIKCSKEPCYVEYPSPEKTLRIWVKKELVNL